MFTTQKYYLKTLSKNIPVQKCHLKILSKNIPVKGEYQREKRKNYHDNTIYIQSSVIICIIYTIRKQIYTQTAI